jgi:PAS domain S-box-containing protein
MRADTKHRGRGIRRKGGEGGPDTKLLEAELRYRTIFEQSPDGILIIDTNGNLMEFNEAAHRQLGYSRKEFEKLSISDIDSFQSSEDIQASIREVLREGRADFEVRHKTKSGEIRHVYVIAQVMDLSGRKVFQTIWHDITEQKRAEEELNRDRDYLENLVMERTAELSRMNEQLRHDIAERKRIQQGSERLILELQEAVARIRTLSGLLPMCAWCKKIRDDKGYWKKVEMYIQEHSDASFTHGICPDCLKKNDPVTYSELFEKENKTQGPGRKKKRPQKARR